MVRRVILILIAISSFAFGADVRYLMRSTPNATTFDTASTAITTWDVNTANSAGDDAYKLVALGFNFPFNNSIYNNVYVGSNGVLTFVNGDTTYTNTALPGPVAQSIYPYWDDLYPPAGGTIKYSTLGSGTSQRFVVTWTDIRHYNGYTNGSGKYTFQVVLYADGGIRFRYNATTNNDGSSATIGVQENQNNYNQYSFDQTIDRTKDVLYTPVRMFIEKTSCVLSDPINGTTNPKRIPGATIRYAVQVTNTAIAVSNVYVTDSVSNIFNAPTIPKVANGACNCGAGGGANSGSVSGNDVTINFGSVAAGSIAAPTKECGYFEAVIK